MDPEPCIKMTIFFPPLCWRCTLQERIPHSTEYEQFRTIFNKMDESDTVERKKTDTKGGRQCGYYLVMCAGLFVITLFCSTHQSISSCANTTMS